MLLELQRYEGGELRVWEKPDPAARYIIGCDPSLGRNIGRGDHSCIHVARRLPGKRLTQAAEWYGRWAIGRVGEALYCLAMAYSYRDERRERNIPALINIERNLAEGALVALQYQGFPEDRFFIPQRFRSVNQATEQQWFFQTTGANKRFLLDVMEDYLQRRAFVIRSEETLDDLASLERDERGNVNLRGHDRAVGAMMAAIVDQDDDEPLSLAPPAKYPECPEHVNPRGWRELHGIPDPSKKRRLPGAAVWTSAEPYTITVT